MVQKRFKKALFGYVYILFVLSGHTLIAQGTDSLKIDSTKQQPQLVETVSKPTMPIEVSYLKPQTARINKIEVRGTFRDPRAIILRSGLALGDIIKIPGEEISGAAKKLWESGFFTDVAIKATRLENREVDLLIELIEAPQISKITFVGIKKGKREDLEKSLRGLLHKTYTQNAVFTANTIIKDYFIDMGRFNPEITHRTIIDTTKNNQVVLEFTVEKGPRVKIEDIVFKGNQALTDAKLRKSLKDTKRYKWWNIFKSSKYIPQDYEKDQLAVLDVYKKYGFRDARIVKDTLIDVSEKRVKLEITINEGNRYYFRNINFEGNTKYTDEFLTKILDIDKGDIFDEDRLTQRLMMDPQGTDISSLYLDDGYLFFNIEPIETGVFEDSIDITVKIYEGKQAIVGDVTVVGNTKTSDHVILRELYTKPGELFKRSDIIRSQRELANLKYFNPESMQVNPRPNPVDGTVDIEYVVEEQPSDQFELQGGYGAGRIVGTLGLSFTNFSSRKFWNKKAWNPIPSGDGQSLSIRAQSSGTWYSSVNFSFVEPWLGGKRPTSLSNSVYYTWLNSTSTGGYQKIFGASLGLGTRLKWPDNFFRGQAAIGYQNYNVYNFSGLNIATDEQGNFNNLNLKLTLSRNSIDQPIYPKSGGEFSLIGQFTLPLVSWTNSTEDILAMSETQQYKWIEYHKYKLHAGWYSRIVDKLVLYSKVNFGLLASYNKNIPISPFERFYMGGSGLTGYNIDGREIIPLRGFTEANSTNVVYKGEGLNGGVAAVKYTMEMRYPISLEQAATIYALVFAEAGNTFSSLKEFDPFEVNRTAGLGVRLYLPMLGMLGFDYGFPFNPANTDLPVGTFTSFPGQFTFTFGGNMSGW